MRQHGLTEDGERIVLHRFHGGVETVPPRGDPPIHRFLFLDLESTGLEPGVDRVIELATVEADIEIETGYLVAHHGTHAWLEDPGVPIPELITQLTGISDDDVRGHAIPDDEVRPKFDAASIVVAHNARFDRAMAMHRFPWLDDPGMPPWACSLEQIDWRGRGHRHANLENLAMDHGFFYSSHRATIDVEALVKLVSMRPEPDAPPYLCDLVADVRRPCYRVAAEGSPFEAKDELRARGHRWDPERKMWARNLPEEEVADEIEWVRALCERFGGGRPISTRIPFARRFDDTYEPDWQRH